MVFQLLVSHGRQRWRTGGAGAHQAQWWMKYFPGLDSLPASQDRALLLRPARPLAVMGWVEQQLAKAGQTLVYLVPEMQ
jgi:hypothetical protein